jgi:hypothetical protein
MQKKKIKEWTPLKEIIQKDPSKFPLGFKALLTVSSTEVKEEPGAPSSFYKTKFSTVFLHHSPVSKPSIF